MAFQRKDWLAAERFSGDAMNAGSKTAAMLIRAGALTRLREYDRAVLFFDAVLKNDASNVEAKQGRKRVVADCREDSGWKKACPKDL